jgi:transcriptional regulator with XRE-family HTH domain
MTFGDELGRLLAERGMSQRELARRSHYDSGYINTSWSAA